MKYVLCLLMFVVSGMAHAADKLPTVTTHTVQQLVEPAWGFMLWTDVTETKQLRAKLLDITAKGACLSKLEGGIVTVPLDKFSKSDRTILERWQSELTRQEEDTAKYTELLDAYAEMRKPVEGTSIQQEAVAAEKKAQFLARFDKMPVILRFVIRDISNNKDGTYNISTHAPRGFDLFDGRDYVSGRSGTSEQTDCGGGHARITVRLTKAQASWLQAGDILVVSGRAQFISTRHPLGFGETVKDHQWLQSPDTKIPQAKLHIERVEEDRTLADTVKARVALLRAQLEVEAAKEAAKKAEEAAENKEPFTLHNQNSGGMIWFSTNGEGPRRTSRSKQRLAVAV